MNSILTSTSQKQQEEVIMNKKNNFNLKLYLATLQQIKSIIIIASVLIVAISIFIPVQEYMSIQEAIKSAANSGVNTDLSNFFMFDYNAPRSTVYLLLIMVLLAPLLSLFCWHYLTKRNTSDFYHSLPYTRRCLYITQTLAIISVLVVVTMLSLIASLICYKAFSAYINIEIPALIKMHIGILCASILCSQAIAIGCFITGTVFSNIIASGLIIFFPRFLLTITLTVITSAVAILSSENFLPLLDNQYNCITSVVLTSLTNSNRWYTGLLSVSSQLYTIALALIYMVIAGVLFVKRKSESATKAAPSKITGAIIRVVIAITICMFAVLTIISNEYHGGSGDSYLTVTISVAVIAALAVFLYEGIANKSVKIIRHCIPSIVIAYAVSVIIYFSINAFIGYVGSYNPEINDINYVTVAPSSDSSSVSYGYTTSSDAVHELSEFYTSKIKITDTKIYTLMKDALSNNQEHLYEDYSFSYYANDNNLKPYKFMIRSNGMSHYRIIYLSQDEIKEISTLLNNNAEYQNAYRTLPDYDNSTIDIAGGSSEAFTPERAKEIYTTLQKEYKEADFQNILLNNSCNTNMRNIIITTYIDGVKYCRTIPITSYLPETLTATFNALNQHAVSTGYISEIKDLLQDAINGETSTNENAQRLYFLFFSDTFDTRNSISISDYIKTNPDKGIETLKLIYNKLDNCDKNNHYDFNDNSIMVCYTRKSPDKSTSSTYLSIYIEY